MEINVYELIKMLAIFFLGLSIGSFLNVIIYRMPREMSIVYPPSTCPECKNRIKWYDNIPVISYIFLKGKCRFCKTPISVRYPTVEFITGVSALVSYLKFGFTVDFIFAFYFLASMIALSFIDWDFKIIPDEINYLGLLSGLIYAGIKSFQLKDFNPLINSFLGAVVGAGFLFLIFYFYLKVRKIEGLGLGDVKLLAFVGSYVGWFGALFTIFFGSVLGLVASLYFMKKEKADDFMKLEIPFGPFLALAGVIYLFFGEKIYNFYFGGF
ncbi:A24 family peptidase [Sulfurihydrogenibium sp.]|uniref:prepilin peptidase n=1 Tax=Sulfurihydrogenibium sp. TaxID=2053621 RepID=UPI002626172F|nr:A24 family peptidase [Sulfurihydrogenibium sp.]